MIFLLGHEIQKELDDVMESHSAEQNLRKFIRSHALINRWKQQLGSLIVSIQMKIQGDVTLATLKIETNGL